MHRESKHFGVGLLFCLRLLPLLAVVVVSIVVGCQREGAKHETSQDERGLTAAAGPKLLEGDPNSSARSALYRFRANLPPMLATEITTEANGRRTDRRALTIGFTLGATVGEVNAALTSVDASIAIMLVGVDMLAVTISDPGDIASYRALILQLEANPIVRFVDDGAMLKAD